MSKPKDQTIQLAGLQLTATVGTPTVTVGAATEEPLFRKGVNLTNQQLGSVERAKKLELVASNTDKYELVEDPSGVVLSYAAVRLLHGILALYERTGRGDEGGYKGHFISYEEEVRRDTSGRETLSRLAIPGLYVTEPELLEAYGVSKSDDGRYAHKQRERVLETLDELSTVKQRIYYERREEGGKRPGVRITAPLLSVQQIEWFDDIVEARAGGDPRANWYKIVPTSLVVDQLATFHFRSHVALYAQIDEELERLRGTKRGRKGTYHALFIEYLQTQNRAEISIEMRHLATKLRLGYMAKQRRTGDMERAILEAAEVALKLGYLLEPMTMAANGASRTICYMKLNPEKCSRVKAPKQLRDGSSS